MVSRNQNQLLPLGLPQLGAVSPSFLVPSYRALLSRNLVILSISELSNSFPTMMEKGMAAIPNIQVFQATPQNPFAIPAADIFYLL